MTMTKAFDVLRRNRKTLRWATREKALLCLKAIGVSVHEIQDEIGRELERHEKAVVLGMLSYQF